MKQKCKYLSRRGLLKPYSKRRRVRLKQIRRGCPPVVDVTSLISGLLNWVYEPSILPLICGKEN